MSTATSSTPAVSQPAAAAPATSAAAQEMSPRTKNDLLMRSAVMLGLAIFMGLLYLFNPPPMVQAKPGVVMQLPVFVGDFFGKIGEITDVEHALLPKDTQFARRIYDDSNQNEITCTIVLSGADQASIHRPEACLDGQGWDIVGQDDVPIQLQSGHKLIVRKLSLQRIWISPSGEHVNVRAFYIYWFVGNNITTPWHFTRILRSNWDRVIHNRAHRWAYVSTYAIATDNLRANGLTPDQTVTAMCNFIRQIVPSFQISEMPQSAAN